MSALEARVSLVFALASQQASSLSKEINCSNNSNLFALVFSLFKTSLILFFLLASVLMDVASDTAKYVFQRVPDLETVEYEVLSRRDKYEIIVVEPYYIAETKRWWM
ncbi:heme-binding-like protein At3g10130, chloroplastic [Tripterygium wilfordii]|uniref:heme-binding-like protein At3g10130, chloroplastic n=1 Tax=Tripterygium wilfordii TaxID=458696 RepID=UPI0018F7F3F4|nr:heme-binding-like protein At3g10130, chloroplastic [Tripterygium wilfordii]